MRFTDEYEVEVNSQTFYVTVEGRKVLMQGREVVALDFIEVYDELSNLVDEDHDSYDDIKADAMSRDYEQEVHSADFDCFNECEEIYNVG